MGLIPRKLIGRLFRLLGYNIEKIKSGDDSKLYNQFPEDSLENKKFLNVGAGKFQHKFWTNIDYGSEQYEKIQTNFVELNLIEEPKFPFEDNSIEIIYTSHTIEHITDNSVINFIKESQRILKKDGVLRITCPDSKLLLNSVKFKVKDFWNWREEWFLKKFNITPKEIELEDFLIRELSTARCRFFDNVKDPLYPKEVREKMEKLEEKEFLEWIVEKNVFDDKFANYHINYWSFEKLKEMCIKAGFSKIYHSGFGQSLSPPLTNTKLFDNTHPKMSLYFEARK
tara:strand:- start:1426 stop:2274 length:849 start_codon:yes stop_codon:yes gene_type:complete